MTHEEKIPAAITAGTRKCVHLSQIRKVEETLDYKMANHMLDEGWQLLEIFQSGGQITYVLGLPSI